MEEIIKKTYQKFYHRYKNASVLLDPTHKNWNPLAKSTNDIKVFKEMKQLVKQNVEKYNKKYLVTTRVGTYKNSEIRLSCNFNYFANGKKKALKSFGLTIILSGEELLNNSVTTKFIFKIVQKMNKLGAGKFQGIKPFSYLEFKNLK